MRHDRCLESGIQDLRNQFQNCRRRRKESEESLKNEPRYLGSYGFCNCLLRTPFLPGSLLAQFALRLWRGSTLFSVAPFFGLNNASGSGISSGRDDQPSQIGLAGRSGGWRDEQRPGSYRRRSDDLA